MSTQFFYGEPGGDVHGPLEWDAIRAGMHAGRTSKNLVVSQTGCDPWVAARDVEIAGFAAFSRAGAATTPPAAPPVTEVKSQSLKANVDQPDPNSVAGFLEIFAWINILVGIVGLIAVLVVASDGGQVFFLAATSLGCLISGVLFHAAAEVLKRLKEISVALHAKE